MKCDQTLDSINHAKNNALIKKIQFDANKLYSTYLYFSHIHSFFHASIVFQHLHNQNILSNVS